MTKNIALLCMAGMSTSLLVNKMKAAALESGIDVNICAYPAEKFEEILEQYDCFLLGPQIRYKVSEYQPIADSANKPLAIIDMLDYGMVNGKAVLDKALSLI